MRFENHVIIEGRLSKKAELEKTESGKVFAKASICFNQFKKLEKPNENGYNYESIPNFFQIIAWEKNAEELSKINVGDAISIIGQLRYSAWEKEGKKYSNVYILVSQIKKILIEKKSDEHDEQSESEYIDVNFEMPSDEVIPF